MLWKSLNNRERRSIRVPDDNSATTDTQSVLTSAVNLMSWVLFRFRHLLKDENDEKKKSPTFRFIPLLWIRVGVNINKIAQKEKEEKEGWWTGRKKKRKKRRTCKNRGKKRKEKTKIREQKREIIQKKNHKKKKKRWRRRGCTRKKERIWGK